MVGAMIVLGRAADKGFYLLVLSGRYVLTNHFCPDETVQNHFEVREGWSVAVFKLVFGPEVIYGLVSPASHTHVPYLMNEKENLVEMFYLKEAAIPA